MSDVDLVLDQDEVIKYFLSQFYGFYRASVQLPKVPMEFKDWLKDKGFLVEKNEINPQA